MSRTPETQGTKKGSRNPTAGPLSRPSTTSTRTKLASELSPSPRNRHSSSSDLPGEMSACRETKPRRARRSKSSRLLGRSSSIGRTVSGRRSSPSRRRPQRLSTSMPKTSISVSTSIRLRPRPSLPPRPNLEPVPFRIWVKAILELS